MAETPVRDRWLFLTPEAEAELPPAVAALAAAHDERVTLESIVVDGGYPEWLAYLRERRSLLERYIDRHGEDALSRHVADVLMNHWLLALTVPGQEDEAETERSRVGAIVEKLGELRRR